MSKNILKFQNFKYSTVRYSYKFTCSILHTVHYLIRNVVVKTICRTAATSLCLDGGLLMLVFLIALEFALPP